MRDHVEGFSVINKTQGYVVSIVSVFLYNHFEIEDLASYSCPGSKAYLHSINFFIHLRFNSSAMILRMALLQ